MENKLKAKLCYASGDIYGGGAFMILSLLFMNFLVMVEGLPILATTVILVVGRLWDAVTDPLFGRLSDKTRSRFGRRRIFFLIGIFPVFISFVMLFYSFGIDNVTLKIIYYIFAYMCFGTVFSVVMVPYNAILSDITSDYNERTSFTMIRMIFSGVASLLSAVVPGIIIKAVGSEKNGPDQIPGYFIMAIIFGAIFGLCWFVAFLGTKERENLPEPEKITLKYWLSVFKNKAYRNFLGIFLSFQIAVDLVLALFIFYIDIVVLQYKNYELIVGTLLVTSVILMVVHSAIAKKKGKAFPLYIGIPVWILTTFVFFWLDQTVSVYVLCALAVLIAVGSSAGNLSTWSMLADIFDIDELRTGKRREGIYSGVTTFLRKFASAIALLVMGFGLKALGFDQDKYNEEKMRALEFDPVLYAQGTVVSGIRLMFVLIPLILLTVCLLFAIKNKINKRRFDAVLKGIDYFKAVDSIDNLSDQETEDILIATGVEKERLWGR